MRKVLLVDDDANIRRIVKMYMENRGFRATTANDGHEAVELFDKISFDLVILDLMLPKLDGFGVCRAIRERSNVPIIMLTAKGQVGERIEGLQTGADDYVIKPFDPNELVARAEAVLRRMQRESAVADDSGLYTVGRLSVNERTYEVRLGEERVTLPRREFELLLFMVKHPNQVFTRNDMIEKVWGWDFEGEDRVVDLYVKRIRQKLGEPEGGKWGIRTVWGVGYKFEVNG